MRVIPALVFCWCASAASAQTDPLAVRHARISDLRQREQHTELLKQVERQLNEAVGTPWQDSIHTYAFTFGRAAWKSQDAEAGIAAVQRIIDLVQRYDKDALHRLNALEAKGKLLQGMGRMKECIAADSLVLAFADADPNVPLIRRGMARQRLASDYAQMGDHENSLRHYTRARDIFAKSDTLLALLMGDACSGMGAAYWHLGDTRKADEQYGLALSYIEQSTDPKRDFRMAGTLINRGILWQSTGDLVRSKANYLESIRRCGAVADTARDPQLREEAILGRTRGYVNLATVYFAMGDDGRSRHFLELALRDRQAMLEPDDPRLLGVKDRLADVELQAKNFAKAEEYVLAFLEACEKYYGTRSKDYLRACSKLGVVRAGLQQDSKADSLFRLSIALHLKLDGSATSIELASAYRRHAQFCMSRGRWSEAVHDLEQALTILEKVHGPQHHQVAGYLLALAEARFGAGDAQGTLQDAERAMALLTDRSDALKNSSVPQAWPQPNLLPDAIYWKVKAGKALGIDAADQWRSELDLSVLALLRNKAVYQDEGSKLGFIGQEKVVFDLAIDLAADDHARSRSSADLDRFLTLAETDRSILLKSRLNEFSSIRFTGVPDTVLMREGQLVAALEIDRDDLDAVTGLAEHERALATFLERLSKDHPQYFAMRYGEPSITLQHVRGKLLTPSRDLLVYALTDEHLHMLVVGSDTAALVRASVQGVAEAVSTMNAAIASRDRKAYARSAHELYQLAFAPVAPLLRKTELLIVPDGDLHKVNFETLLFEPPTEGNNVERMLIQKHAIAYLLSVTTAVQFAGLKKEPSGKVLAFAPGFSDELKQHYIAQVPDTGAIDHSYLDLVRQPFAVSTAEALGSMVNARVQLAAEASEQRFREMSSRHGILHLGTHAEMNATSPMYSRLVFSKDGAGLDPDADGYLHAYEIYELDLRAQLAVLTACETGAGTADVEGVRSWATASRTLVAPAW
ncbi:MAG: CHAT domain-containing protein [Flavobacteriales bacterium]|nr:CHAT domain-containing protein [Flavobacteriales bacterium]